MSPQKARSELMKFDSGPDVGTVRSEKLSAVKFGVIAQSSTTGSRGGAAALTGAATNPIASTVSASTSRRIKGRTPDRMESNFPPPIVAFADPPYVRVILLGDLDAVKRADRLAPRASSCLQAAVSTASPSSRVHSDAGGPAGFSGCAAEAAAHPSCAEPRTCQSTAADLDVAPLDDPRQRPIGVVVLAGLRIRVPRILRDRADAVRSRVGTLAVVLHSPAVELADKALREVARVRDAAAHVRGVPLHAEAVDADVDEHVEATAVQLHLSGDSAVRALGRREREGSERAIGPDHVSRAGGGRQDRVRRGRRRLSEQRAEWKGGEEQKQPRGDNSFRHRSSFRVGRAPYTQTSQSPPRRLTASSTRPAADAGAMSLSPGCGRLRHGARDDRTGRLRAVWEFALPRSPLAGGSDTLVVPRNAGGQMGAA